MGQRRFSDCGGAVEPVRIPPLYILFTRFIGYPVHDVIEERLAGAVHTAEVAVIAGVDRLQTPEFYSVLLYSVLLCSVLLCPLSLQSLQSLSLHTLSLCSLYANPLRINY